MFKPHDQSRSLASTSTIPYLNEIVLKQQISHGNVLMAFSISVPGPEQLLL
jgi:hypothetical protein